MSGKSLILCKSIHHQNTAKVARAMADVLGADVTCPEEFSSASLSDYELVGFGSGVYYGRLHGALYDWLRGLNRKHPDERDVERARKFAQQLADRGSPHA